MFEIVEKECPIVENEFRVILEVKVTRNWVNESFLGFKGYNPFSFFIKRERGRKRWGGIERGVDSRERGRERWGGIERGGFERDGERGRMREGENEIQRERVGKGGRVAKEEWEREGKKYLKW